MWLRLCSPRIQNAIDLSGLDLDYIKETEEAFEIGAMCSLRSLETHPELEAYFCGAIKESVRHIVGVQFRNQATVGGSIYGRFGFSDVLTCLLALDTEVVLVHAGKMTLAEFADRKRDRDILEKIIIKKMGAESLICPRGRQRPISLWLHVLYQKRKISGMSLWEQGRRRLSLL